MTANRSSPVGAHFALTENIRAVYGRERRCGMLLARV